MKQVLTFFLALTVLSQASANLNDLKSQYPMPLRASAIYVGMEGCCIEILVTVEQWDGINWQLVGQASAFVNAFGDDCCPKSGVSSSETDPHIYELYQTDDDMKNVIDDAINEFLQAMQQSKTGAPTVIESKELKLFLTPEHHLATVTVKGATHERTTVGFEIFDMAGRRVFYDDRYQMERREIFFTTKILKPGTYIFKANIGGELLSTKFTVQ